MTKSTAKKKPLLTLEEKKTIRAARKILKRLTAKWEKLEAWTADTRTTVVEDQFLDELEHDHIDILDGNAFIDLEN